MIYYFQPFDTNKKIARSHNEHVRLVTDPDDWIVITDPDTMFLTSDCGNIIEKAVATYGDQYQLMGCLTNRISVPHLQYKGISEETDIRYHIEIAKHLRHRNEVKECNLVAGFFMLFQRKTWDWVGGFKEGITFDIDLSNKVLAAGGKLGVIQSLYMWHSYRLGSTGDLRYNTKHLL